MTLRPAHEAIRRRALRDPVEILNPSTLDAVFPHQKSNCALIFASRAAMIDAGFKYVGP